MNLPFTLAGALLLLVHCTSSQEKSWSWNEPDPVPQASEQDFAQVSEQDFHQADGSDYVESSLPLNSTLTEQVVDEILTSTREGRALEGFQEVYSDPNIQDALQKGDDGEARNIIKDRLCSLGLVQCDEHIEGKRPYIAPEELVYAQPVAINPVGRPIPTIPLKGVRGGGYGPPKPVPFPPGKYPPISPPHGKFGPPKPPRRHFGPPPNKPYYSKPEIYEAGGEYLSKPPPFSNSGSHPTLDSPYQFEYGSHQSAHHKDKRVEIHVNAQGGTASAVSTPGSVALEHVHHHYHHNLDGNKAPLTPLAAAAVSSSNTFGSSSSSFGSHPNSLGSVSGSFGSLSGSLGSSSGSFGSHSGSLGSSSSFADSSGGFAPLGATGLGSFSSSGLNAGVYGGQTVASYGGTFGSSKPVVETYVPQTLDSFGTSVGSYGSSGLYKKELNVSPVNGNFLQSYADKYQGLESARAENYDCVCVPYDQCPTHDVIGRKDDLYLALDPRSLKSDIEASLDEEERVITDGNGTMSVIRVPKNVNITEDRKEEKTEEPEKKISKREAEAAEKKNDEEESPEGRQFYGGLGGRPQACGPRHVCCRKPLRPQVPQVNGRQCGVRHSQGINGRIKNPVYVDGDSEFGEYPWQVAILKKDPKESVYVCGGTLVDPLHILTAAHCVKTYTGLDLRVRLGEWDVNHDVEFYPYIERDIASVNVHPEFYAGTLYNDIAILRMDKPVDFAKHPHISPACLPYPRDDYTGTRCWTTGWGKDAFGDFGKYQNILKEVDVPVLNSDVCQRQMQQTRLGYDFKLHPGFICAGGEAGKDACKGDGGGPMVCERSGTWQVVGIVSWGIGCGQVGVPGVYVKVAHYLDWIRQVTQRY